MLSKQKSAIQWDMELTLKGGISIEDKKYASADKKKRSPPRIIKLIPCGNDSNSPEVQAISSPSSNADTEK